MKKWLMMLCGVFLVACGPKAPLISTDGKSYTNDGAQQFVPTTQQFKSIATKVGVTLEKVPHNGTLNAPELAKPVNISERYSGYSEKVTKSSYGDFSLEYDVLATEEDAKQLYTALKNYLKKQAADKPVTVKETTHQFSEKLFYVSLRSQAVLIRMHDKVLTYFATGSDAQDIYFELLSALEINLPE